MNVIIIVAVIIQLLLIDCVVLLNSYKHIITLRRHSRIFTLFLLSVYYAGTYRQSDYDDKYQYHHC